MNNEKIAVIFLFILLIIPLASALELNSNELTRSTCQGNTLLFTANVFGNGNFNANLDGSASSWSTAVPNGFILRNNARQVYVYSTPNNNVAPGRYNLNLIVSSNKETRRIPFTINVENCHGLQLTGDGLKEICGGSVASYNYQIKNSGNYKESFQLTLKGPRFITLSQDKISLVPGETKNVYAYIGQDSESSKFTVFASNKYGTAEINSELRVNSCYDFSLSADRDFINLCEHSQEKTAIEVKNSGIHQDFYNLELKGPEWASLEKSDFILNPEKSEKTNLVLSPDYSINGNFEIELKANSKESSKTKTFKVQVDKCYDVFLDIKEKEINLCNNARVPVFLKNTGLFEKDFRIETSEQWASLDEYKLKLKPNEEKNLNLMIDVNNIERKSHDVYARILALDGSGLEKEDKIKINILNQNQCHSTQIISDSRVTIFQSSSSTLPITIRNNGNEKLVYEISITGDASSFTQINPSVFELNNGESEIVYLYSAPSVEINPGIYNADIGISYNRNLLASKSISINVKESAVKEDKEYVPFLLRFANFLESLSNKNETINKTDEKPKAKKQETVKNESAKEYVPFSYRIAGLLSNLFGDKNETIGESKDIVTEEKSENIIEDANRTGLISGIYEKARPYWIYVLVGAVIIIVLIFIFSSKGEDESEEDFEEGITEDENEDEEETSSLWKWLIGIVVIAGIAYAQIKYNLFEYAKRYTIIAFDYAEIYKFYILIALIFILIIILTVKYWSLIIDFFEEDETPRRKRRKNGK